MEKKVFAKHQIQIYKIIFSDLQNINKLHQKAITTIKRFVINTDNQLTKKSKLRLDYKQHFGNHWTYFLKRSNVLHTESCQLQLLELQQKFSSPQIEMPFSRPKMNCPCNVFYCFTIVMNKCIGVRSAHMSSETKKNWGGYFRLLQILQSSKKYWHKILTIKLCSHNFYFVNKNNIWLDKKWQRQHIIIIIHLFPESWQRSSSSWKLACFSRKRKWAGFAVKHLHSAILSIHSFFKPLASVSFTTTSFFSFSVCLSLKYQLQNFCLQRSSFIVCILSMCTIPSEHIT